jgi:hypothetical protein
MRWPIYLDDETQLRRTEIGNKVLDSELATKFHPSHLIATQPLPKFILGGSWLFSHLAGQRFQLEPEPRCGLPF